MWLLSLGLHGLLLIMPIPSLESSNSSEKQQELVSLIQLKPSPSSSSKPVAPKPKATASPTPTRPVVPRPPTPVAAPIVPTPVPAVTPLLTTKEVPAPPQPTPLPTPSPIADVVQDPIPDVPQLGTSEIAGVPVDSSWQTVEAPAEVLSEANMFTQPNGQLHPDIVGQVAQVPGKNPDQVFEEFFSSKLNTKFQVEPSGTYVPGGGLYKLTTEERSQPLYLALAPTKDGTGTVVTIWNNFPSPLE